MYCDKPHVNQLTALLKAYPIHHVVVCPGSRNGILVHNFHAAQFVVHPVTDERSAAFVALGLCLSTREPVALCVTSGSALLNTLPATAEAAYRNLPLLVISADRPQEWIGQLDGQTLPQCHALMPYARSFQLNEWKTATEGQWNNLLINEALLLLKQNGGQPVHLNVPISEPLFNFHTEKLPQERLIVEEYCQEEGGFSPATLAQIQAAELPIVMMGQYEKGALEAVAALEANNALLFLPEIIAGQTGSWRSNILEHWLPEVDFQPDLVIHIGGNLVHKQTKLLLRKLPSCPVIRIEPSPALPDTFRKMTKVIRTSPENALKQLAGITGAKAKVVEWKKRLDLCCDCTLHYSPQRYSDIGILHALRAVLPSDCALQVGNSSVIRNAAHYFDLHNRRLFCNRGLNGIEGSLSTAVGYALGYEGMTFCLIGDLSFFYDQNALWNQQLPSRLRILLFNNSGGQIFYRLPGLDQTPALSPYIAASHHTSARGVAESYGLTYLAAHNYEQLGPQLERFLDPQEERPVLLEVFTQREDNENERIRIKEYIKAYFYGKKMEQD